MNGICPIPSYRLDAYALKALNDREREDVEIHVRGCDRCLTALTSLRVEAQMLGRALRRAPAPAMRRSARELVQTAAEPQAGTPGESGAIPVVAAEPSSRWWIGIGAVAALLLLAIGFVGYLGGYARLQRVRAMEIRKWEEERARERAEWSVRFGQLEQNRERIREEAARSQKELDAAHRKALDKERIEHTEDRDRLQREVREKNRELEETSDRAVDRAIEKMLDAGSRNLRLTPEEDLVARWESRPKALEAQRLRHRGRDIGWAMSLNPAAGAATPAGPMPSDPAQKQAVLRQRLTTLLSQSPSFAGPAAMGGRVYAGNGWGSTRLSAFEGQTGKLLWAYDAHDNGPGLPSFSDDGNDLYFGTESCTIYALVSATGKQRWSRWLGDPLLTQPTVSGSNLFVVHKDGKGRGVGDGTAPYTLSCLETQMGTVNWFAPLAAEALSAPVAHGKTVYVATRDGILSAYEVVTGRRLWASSVRATSSPVCMDGTLYFSRWESSTESGFQESLLSIPADGRHLSGDRLLGPFPAPYLVQASPDLPWHEALESDFVLDDAADRKILGLALKRPFSKQPVFGHAWKHLGARPTLVDQKCFVVLGDRLVCLRSDGHVRWSCQVDGHSYEGTPTVGRGEPALTPPSYAGGKLYLGSAWGDLLCINARTGSLDWRYRLPDSKGIVAQIVLDEGRAYAATQSGLLVCIEANDSLATGWPVWGGASNHNAAIQTR